MLEVEPDVPCEVTECVPGKVFEFVAPRGESTVTRWRYEFAPNASGGTTVTEPFDAPLINVMVNVRSPSRAGIAYCVGVAVHPSHCALAHTTRRARPSLLDDTATSVTWRCTATVCRW